MDESQSAALQEAALQAFMQNDLAQALQYLDQALSVDFENKRTLGMLKYAVFWQGRFNHIESLADNLAKVDYLFEQWRGFAKFRDRVGLHDEPVIHALRRMVFGQAINLLQLYNNHVGVRNPQILRRIGFCHKAIGNFGAACKLFDTALRLEPDNAEILAELADSYALSGDEELAKLLFKEAFSVDPGAIRLETLESALIRRLAATVEEQQVSPESVAYWIPIFGTLTGVFTVHRQLKPTEYGRLRQQVYNLEREYQDKPETRGLTLPRLLYNYFRLLEHAKQTDQPKHVRDELLLKIESLHPGVFKLYTQ